MDPVRATIPAPVLNQRDGDDVKQNEERMDFPQYIAVDGLVGVGTLKEGTSAYAVALRAIHDGYHSLSPDERAVYDTEIMPAFLRRAEELKALNPVEFGGRRLEDGAHGSGDAL